MRRSIHILIVAISLAAVTGCTTTKEATDALHASWIGRNTDDFFTQWGPPRSSIKLNNGNTLYTWSSVQHVELPSVSNTYGTMDQSGSFSATTMTDAGGSMPIGCVVRILASPTGNILNIAAVNDTIGWWETSRCHEIFGGQ